jgi:hypothetical protein
MARDFEDHCWKDVIDPDTLQIYRAYHRKVHVGANPAVLAIDLYNKAYLGGDRPVIEVDGQFSGSCGENAWRALPHTQQLFAAARRAGVRDEAIDVLRAKGDVAKLAPDEREIVAYTRQLIRTNRVDQAAFDTLQKKYGTQWLVELTAAANYFALLSGIVNAFDVAAPADGDKLPA